MKDLIIVATIKEILPFLETCKYNGKISEGEIKEFQHFDLLVSGPGMLATAVSLTAALEKNNYAVLFNFGIAGSFKKDIPIGSTVNIVEETLGDFGAEAGEEEYMDIFEMGLLSLSSSPFTSGKLLPFKSDGYIGGNNLRAVKSVSVNRVLSHEKSIKWVRAKYDPDVVNMEGAAVFYLSNKYNLPCIQIRTISDFVGTRDKASWDINRAIKQLNFEAIKIYDERYKFS
jgi:futalosine hydrolase